MIKLISVFKGLFEDYEGPEVLLNGFEKIKFQFIKTRKGFCNPLYHNMISVGHKDWLSARPVVQLASK